MAETPDEQRHPAVPPSVWGLGREALRRLMAEHGHAPFRGTQLQTWVFGRFTTDPSAMSDLPLPLRRELSEERWLRLSPPPVVSIERSEEGDTVKFAVSFAEDEPPVECVLMLHRRRRRVMPSICISSQLGCAMGCRFCATASMGLIRNLAPWEMVFQVWLCMEHLHELHPAAAAADKQHRKPSVMIMGMGEPLANYASVARAVELLGEPGGFDFSRRKITVSTSGISTAGILSLAEDFPGVNLALSLNAPTDELRRKLMPVPASRHGLKELLSAMQRHFELTGRRPTFEYVLLKGINDSQRHAHALAALLEESRGLLNLIPYNPTPVRRGDRGEETFAPPAPECVERFSKILEAAGLTVTVRKSAGTGIAAGCGQLASLHAPKSGKEKRECE